MFNDSTRLRRTAGWVAVFALPLVAVQLAGLVSGGGAGPAIAGAATPTSEIGAHDALVHLMIPVRPPRPNDAERSALDRASELRAEHFGPTPMLHAAPRIASPPKEDPGETAPLEQDPEVPSLQLQAIMSGTTGNSHRALINNRLHSLGEFANETQWIIIDINADARRITLQHETTRRAITIKLETP